MRSVCRDDLYKTTNRCVTFGTRYRRYLIKIVSVCRMFAKAKPCVFISQNKNLLNYVEHAPRDDAFSISINSQGPRKCCTFRCISNIPTNMLHRNISKMTGGFRNYTISIAKPYCGSSSTCLKASVAFAFRIW